jgi:hypothetical protein
MDKPTGSSVAGAKQQIEKQARQLAYDTRYKVKQAMSAKSGARLDPAAVRKAYMAQLGKSSAAPAVKARAKQMLLGEDLIDARELANDSLVSALYKVFVEGIEVVEETEQLDEMEEKKYKVRVTDKKTGNTYIRNASRSKIAELRRNPNISSVEMTGYGEVSKSESSKGESTAKTKSGKGLDPVGQEDKDIDNDGDHDKTDKYLLNRRKVRGKAIATRSEEVIYEKEQTHAKAKKITGEGVNNYKSKAVKVSPDVSEQASTLEKEKEEKTSTLPSPEEQKQIEMKKKILQKKLMLQRQTMQLQKQGKLPLNYSEENEIEEKMDLAKADMGDVVKDFYKSDAPQFKGRTKEERRKMAIAAKLTAERGGKKLGEENEGCGCGKTPCECGNVDEREMPTKSSLLMNKLRAKGIKVAGTTPSPRNMKTYDELGEELLDERRKEDKVAGTPRKPRNPAFEIVAKAMGAGRMGVQPRGQKKEPGKKPPVAGQYGAPKSPAQKVAMRRAAAQRAQDNMSSRFD